MKKTFIPSSTQLRMINHGWKIRRVKESRLSKKYRFEFFHKEFPPHPRGHYTFQEAYKLQHPAPVKRARVEYGKVILEDTKPTAPTLHPSPSFANVRSYRNHLNKQKENQIDFIKELHLAPTI